MANPPLKPAPLGALQHPGYVDLSGLALHLAFRSIVYVALATMTGATVGLLAMPIGFLPFVDRHFKVLVVVLWILLEIDIVRRIQRIARSASVIRSDTRSLHGFELATGLFLGLYALARPYLTDADASSYPYLKIIAEGFIAILALCHCLVLGIFRRKPDRWDAVALGTAVAGAVVSIATT